MSFKLSLSYWRKHPAKLGIMVIILLSGIIALVLTLLFVRSSKMQQMDYLLSLHGDYDFIVYDCKYDTADEIAALEKLDGSGIYERVENVSVESSYTVPAFVFRDKESERIFHLSMFRGRNPESPDEIALDLQYAKSCGIYPYPGEKISVDINGELKEFKLVGLFELRDDSAWGGFYRYFEIFSPGQYDPPQIILDSSYFDSNSGGTYTVFCQKNSGDTHELYQEAQRIGEANGEELFDSRIQHSTMRGFAYSAALGTNDFGDIKSLDETTDIVGSGGAKKDIFACIIPVFAALIGCVTVISLYQLMKNIYEDRMHNSGIMLSIGMSKSDRLLQLVLEPIIVTLILLPTGLFMAAQMFRLIVKTGGVQNALLADDLIKKVTFDPWTTTIVVITASVIVVSALFILRYRKSTVLQLLDGKNAHAKRKPLHGRACRKSGWFSIIFKNISFTTASVCLLIIIGMSSMTFGLVFSSEYGRYQSSDTGYLLEENGMANADYLAERQDSSAMLPNIENHHDYGVLPQVLDEFVKQNGSDIAGTMACIVNSSGMLVLDGEYDDLPYSLADFSLTPKPVKDNNDGVLSFDEAEAYSALAIWEKTGYSADDKVYSTPFVGLDENGFEKMEKLLVEGSIDRTAIANGNECILAVGEFSYKGISEIFHVGDEITLSDIIVSEETDKLNASKMSLDDMGKYGELAYSDTINEDGTNVPITGYCMGKRHDVKVKIGGIVTISSESDEAFYLQKGKVNIFVAPETFGAWGLPDTNYTNVAMKLNEGVNVTDIDRAWYGMLGECNGMKSRSVGELLEKYDSEANGMKRIFLRLEVMLVLLIMIGIVLALYSRLKQQSVNVASLRAIGMRKPQLAFISLLQNELLVLLGGIASVLPVYGFYRLSMFAQQRNMDNNAIVESADTPKHWTDIFLYEDGFVYNVFDVKYIKEWIFVIVLFALISAVVSVLPIVTQSRLKIIDDLKKE